MLQNHILAPSSLLRTCPTIIEAGSWCCRTRRSSPILTIENSLFNLAKRVITVLEFFPLFEFRHKAAPNVLRFEGSHHSWTVFRVTSWHWQGQSVKISGLRTGVLTICVDVIQRTSCAVSPKIWAHCLCTGRIPPTKPSPSVTSKGKSNNVLGIELRGSPDETGRDPGPAWVTPKPTCSSAWYAGTSNEPEAGVKA